MSVGAFSSPARTGSWPGETSGSWSRREMLLLVATVIAGIAIRLLLIGTDGDRGDIDQFARWTGFITTQGLAHTYDPQTAFEPITYGPVMATIWASLGVIAPGFASASDASDPVLRILLKAPAVVADLGIAACVAYTLRSRPTLAIVATAVVLLHPAIWYVTSWWGQYESIYVLETVVAALLLLRGRPGLAAAALVLAILTKPQAVVFVVPFAAWVVATQRPARVARSVLIGLAVGVVIWLPYLGTNGPANYIANVAQYQNGIFSLLSYGAWNLWWLVQNLGTSGGYASDLTPIWGPITFRVLGFMLAGGFLVLIAYRIWRDPRPRTLVVGVAATSLIAFSFLTTMHERYAYPALVILTLLLAESRVRWILAGFSVVFTLNLIATVPATPELRSLVPLNGTLGLLGSIGVLAAALLVLRELWLPPSTPGIHTKPPSQPRKRIAGVVP